MSTYACPRCGAEYDAGEVSCPKCGLSFSETPTVVTDANRDDGLADGAPFGALESELRAALAPRLLLVRLLGHGGMGSVYLARDPALKRNVVVKVLAPWLAQDAAARARFEREAQSAAAVSHPGVVSVFQVGELPRSGLSYFVMQHVDGATLEDAFPPGTLVPEARARRVVGDIAAALAAAHRQGLVHRDIKPANVMLERETDRVVVLDFGISAAATVARKQDLGTKLTQEGSSIGTPEFMSPEQAVGEEVTDRSDVYSLGVLAFRLLAGRLPFEAASAVAMMAAHLKDTPPKLAALRPDLDGQVAALVDRMLAKAPGARPAAEEVARALRPTVHPAIEWPPPGLEPLRGTLSRGLRYWQSALAVGIAFFGVLGLQPFMGQGAFVSLAAAGAFASAMLLAAASLGLGMASSMVVSARRSGYPLGVAVDVGLDRFHDTGLVLASAGPYAEVAPSHSPRLLRRRRIAAGLAGAGVLLSMLVAFLWALGWLGPVSDAYSPVGIRDLLLMASPAVCGALAAASVERPERRLRRRTRLHREPMRSKARIPGDLVGSWLAASGRRGPAARSWPRVFLSLQVLDAVPALAMLAFMSAILAGLFRPIFLDWGERPSQRAIAAWEQSLHAELSGAVSWHSLDAQVARAARAGVGPGDTAAMRAVLVYRERSSPNLGSVWDAFRAMPGALPDSLRQSLTVMGSDSSVGALDRLARGGPVELAHYVGPGAFERDSAEALGRRLRNTSSLAARQAARTALDLADGRRLEAEARARTILALGWQLWRTPIPAAHAGALGILDIGVRALHEIGTVAGDHVLLREADRLAGVVASRRQQASRMSPRRFEDYVSAPSDTLLQRLIADRRLAPVDRWRLIEAVADGACWRPREVHAGVSPARRAALERAQSLASDLPQTADWVAAQDRVLEAVDEGRNPHAPSLFRFFPPVARSFACAGVRGGSL